MPSRLQNSEYTLPSVKLGAEFLRSNNFRCSPNNVLCDDAQKDNMKDLFERWIDGVCSLSGCLRKFGRVSKESNSDRYVCYFFLSGSSADKSAARSLIESEILPFLRKISSSVHFKGSGNSPKIYFKMPTRSIDYLNLEKCSQTYGALLDSAKEKFGGRSI